ncbi:hypothetical protein K402DRAFT_274002 [Aulographum hederae CBS 113979]|uniref:C3H1-type domain-containing protein n=1 Tax=Aulographum hederae CBS 113979 TaxID=1176131 RepID=A0A6G1H966_9PEZI|nr:hypothetical protein K402DRAFT_274002 [Aulographum hederae CBS 113979]
MSSSTTHNVKINPCHDWPLGKCKHEQRCTGEHHENLDPALVETNAYSGYMVPNEVGEGCVRCMQRMFPCDKKARGTENDPCSECRWFGGANCRCTLATDTSYNDQIWAVMMARGRDKNYTLPADKSREEGGKKAKSAPQPMPANSVKAGWQGETREALLNKADMLPSGVRDCPRAYLGPPRMSAAAKKSLAWKETGLKRELESAAESMPPPTFYSRAPLYVLPTFPPPPEFERPPASSAHGKVMTTSYSWETDEYTHTYENGTGVTGRATVAPTPNVRSSYDMLARKKQRIEPGRQKSAPSSIEDDTAANEALFILRERSTGGMPKKP